MKVGDTQVWEIYNNTMDSHPIHLHLVKFQVVSRQGFVANVDGATGVMSDIKVKANAQPPAANERGWKDTVVVNPGEVVRVIATFDKVGAYVWHCHILSHEEHDMMRPLMVLDDSSGAMPMQLLNMTARPNATFSGVAIGGVEEDLLATL
jgi:spore coat protein A